MVRRYNSLTVPNPQGKGWVNEVKGEIVSKHQRKDTAVERGRTIAKEIATEHSIHNLDGTIGRKNSYGGESTVHDKNR
jgi:hypothetical protein